MFVFSNLATSIDGKIGVASRAHFMLGTREDSAEMMRLRRDCDAILMGAATIRGFKHPCLIRDEPVPTRQPINVVLSRSLEGFSPDWKFFTDSRIERILLVTGRLDPDVRKTFSASSKIIDLPQNGQPIALEIIQALKPQGIARLLVEGGGGVIWDFASENLIDEYHLTLTPKVVGGTEAPTLVDGTGFGPESVLNLKLKSHRVVGDEIFLVYQKTLLRGPLPSALKAAP